jgi:beta-galactosidase
VADEQLSVYADAAPHGLTECFGMSYNQFTNPSAMKLFDEPVQYFAELLLPDTAQTIAAYEHKYWSRYAGITKNKYGQGCAYYIGAYTSSGILKKIYQDAAKEAAIPLSDFQWPVIIRSGTTPDAGKLHYIFHYSQNETKIRCPYKNTVNLLDGAAYQAGDTISLTDWDVVILQEQE